MKRRAIFRKSLRDYLLFASILLPAFGATAQTTNNLSDAEIHGRQLAQQILELRPTANSTNIGILQIRYADGKHSEIPVSCDIVVTATNWQSIYSLHRLNTNESKVAWAALWVTHSGSAPNQYQLYKVFLEAEKFGPINTNLSGDQIIIPFANSDFWICDLGLEFFHWPDQKILKGETMRGVFCKVLESTNPAPPTNGYSRVVSWIDNESLGIVQAKAYGAKGNLLKEFYPKDIKKVAGQWQVGSMEIDNVQTRSRTILKFDLKPN